MTVYEVRNRLNELLNTGQITGDEIFGLLKYSYEEGDYFWTPDELNISDNKVEMS